MPEYLSNNFTWEEFIFSHTANKMRIDNTPAPEIFDEIKRKATNLCNHLLQPIRNTLGPTEITSGYSCPKLAKALGRKPNSQHNKGEAADIVFQRHKCLEAAYWIRDNCSYDQLIYERRWDKWGNDYDWVHVSYVSEAHNRKQVLYSPPKGGYVNGLPIK